MVAYSTVTRQTQKSTFRRDDDTFRIRRELTVITSVGEVVGDVVVSSDVADGDSDVEADDVDMSVVVEVDVELEVVDDELVVSDAEEDTADMVLLLTDGSGTNKTSPA